MDNKCGIYQIYSKSKPDRFYIGSSNDIIHRWYGHKYHLKTGTHHCHKMQYHVNKYGIADIGFKIIEICDESNIVRREQHYIDILNPYFNECRIAGNITGIKRTPEVCLKISIAKKGAKYNVTYIPTPEHRKKLSEASKGKPKSEQHRKNMKGQFKKGQIIPEKTIEAVRNGAKRSWRENREGRTDALKRAWVTRREKSKSEADAKG